MFIEVEREFESLLALIEHFATSHNLLDGVLVGTHRIIHLLHSGQYGFVELMDRFIELCPLEAFFLQIASTGEDVPRHRGGDAPRHTSPLAYVLHIVRGIPEGTVQEKAWQPVFLRGTQQGRLCIDLSFRCPHIGPTEQQLSRHTHPYRLHIVGQGTGCAQSLRHILRIKSQEYRQRIEILNHTCLGDGDGSQRAIIDRFCLSHIEFRDQPRLVSGFRDGHHRLLRSRIATEYIHLLLHLAEVEVGRCHLGTKAHHRGIVLLLASRIEFLLCLRLLPNHPEHIELPTHLHGGTIIPRPRLRSAVTEVSARLLAFPSTIEGQGRIKFTLRNPPLRLGLVDAVDSHKHRRVLLHRQVDERIEGSIFEHLPPLVIHRQHLLEKRVLLLPPIGQRTLQILVHLLGFHDTSAKQKA